MNILIRNVDIITSDSKNMLIKNGNIGISNGYIDFVEHDSEKIKSFKADRIIEGKNRIAMPGLVNAHTHSPMTIFRNFGDDLKLEDWLFNKIIPAEAKLTTDDVYWGAMLGIAEMIKSGTTCFADMYLHMEEVVTAVEESGIRVNISKGPIQSSVRSKSGLAVDIEGCTEYYKYWNNKANGRIKVYVEIHSVYLFDEESIRTTASLAKQLGTGIHIHVLETLGEREASMKKYGLDSAEVCLNCGIFDVPVIAAHCVHLTDNDMEILRDKKVNAVHNPSSNLKLGSGIARIPEMMKEGINIALGTDGAASNNNLNMFEEIHLTALIHKGFNRNPEYINADQAIKIATINGAKAIGYENEVGCIKTGMKADLILLNTDKPHFCPINNPVSAVVYSAQAADVDTVIVDGNILMEGRELKTIDEEKIKYRVSKIAERILE